MIRLVRAEFLKLRTTQVWFWMLMGTIAVSGLLVVGQIAPRDGVRTSDKVPELFASSSTAYLVVFVLGVLGITTEFRYQTITPTVLQTPSRWAIITAKMIAYAVAGAVYAAVAVATQLAVAVPWLKAKNVTVDFGNADVRHTIIGVFAVVALFGIVGLGIGALLRNQIVAVVVGLLFLLVLENILVAIPVVKQAWPYMPGTAAQAILYTSGDNSANGVHILNTGGGVVTLLLWAFIPAVIGAAFSMNRDIT
jgi:ABC-2 type transport system permease protein